MEMGAEIEHYQAYTIIEETYQQLTYACIKISATIFSFFYVLIYEVWSIAILSHSRHIHLETFCLLSAGKKRKRDTRTGPNDLEKT